MPVFGRLGEKGASNGMPESWTFQNALSRFLPPERGYTGKRREASAPLYKPSKKNQEGFFVFRWYDVPSSVIRFHDPLVLIEAQGSDGTWSMLRIGGVPQNDQGYDMSLAYLGKTDKKGMGLYEARWYAPSGVPLGKCRFVVLPREDKPALTSNVFGAF